MSLTLTLHGGPGWLSLSTTRTPVASICSIATALSIMFLAYLLENLWRTKVKHVKDKPILVEQSRNKQELYFLFTRCVIKIGTKFHQFFFNRQGFGFFIRLFFHFHVAVILFFYLYFLLTRHTGEQSIIMSKHSLSNNIQYARGQQG